MMWIQFALLYKLFSKTCVNTKISDNNINIKYIHKSLCLATLFIIEATRQKNIIEIYK